MTELNLELIQRDSYSFEFDLVDAWEEPVNTGQLPEIIYGIYPMKSKNPIIEISKSAGQITTNGSKIIFSIKDTAALKNKSYHEMRVRHGQDDKKTILQGTISVKSTRIVL